MSDRFKNDVWSVVARQLGHLIEKQGKHELALERQLENRLKIQPLQNSVVVQTNESSWSDSERLLILSILKCLGRVFQHKDCGFALSMVFPSASSMLFPFLDNNDDAIAASAMEALKAVAEIDCDILWRPLLELSGRRIPPCPLKRPLDKSNTSSQSSTAITMTPPQVNSKLALKCQKLMEYIELLPEQPLR